MRRGEVLGLTWAAIDFEKGSLDVKQATEEVGKSVSLKAPKTKRSKRTIALPAFVIAAIHAHRLRQREWMLQCGAGYDREMDLVNAAPDGGIWRPSTFSDRYIALARSLGIRGGFHDLRHSHASALIAAGVDSRSVANRLGHANVGFTMQRYVHAGSESDRKAATTVDAILLGPGEGAANEGRP